MSTYENRRFPCEQSEYAKTVGKLLVSILKEIFNDLGFGVEVNPLETNGADMQVFLGKNLILAAEVLNWSIGSRLTDRRKNNIIRNLSQHSCNKLLIHTVPLSNTNGFEGNRIHLLEIGFQILPITYYVFFLRKGQIEKRWIDSDSTRRHIRAKILDYINSYLFAHKYLKYLL